MVLYFNWPIISDDFPFKMGRKEGKIEHGGKISLLNFSHNYGKNLIGIHPH